MQVFKTTNRILFFSIIGFILLLSAILNPLLSQEAKGSIKGKVFDSKDNEELIGANVLFHELTLGTATNVRGEYKIDNVPVGKQLITVRYVGYKEKVVEVLIEMNKTVELDFSLTTNNFKCFREMVVTDKVLRYRKKKINVKC